MAKAGKKGFAPTKDRGFTFGSRFVEGMPGKGRGTFKAHDLRKGLRFRAKLRALTDNRKGK